MLGITLRDVIGLVWPLNIFGCLYSLILKHQIWLLLSDENTNWSSGLITNFSNLDNSPVKVFLGW